MKHTMAIEIVAAGALDAVEMEKQQGISSSNPDRSIPPFQVIVGQIPGCEIGAEMLDDMDTAEQLRQSIEISLVGKSFAFHAIVTPFDATFPPPAQRSDPFRASAHAYP